MNDFTFKINGEAREMILYEEGVGTADDVYIIYTDDIKVVNFGKDYQFELTDGTSTQTLTYSVNAYSAAKWGTGDPDVVNALARTMYRYGVSAINYRDA